jgi:hypothetical protein
VSELDEDTFEDGWFRWFFHLRLAADPCIDMTIILT